MEKRYKSISASEQLDLRREAIEAILARPKWLLLQAISHMRRTVRLTTAEMAKLSGVSRRTLQDIEQERSEGSVQTMNRILGVLGLRLGVCRIIAPPLDRDC
jgi:DNA-binding XRE family transcriptional regulator